MIQGELQEEVIFILMQGGFGKVKIAKIKKS